MSQDNKAPLEIERKFLIRRPDTEELAKTDGAVRYDIEQIYLPTTADGDQPRIRRRVGTEGVECFYTVKRRISDVTREEIEQCISEERFHELADGVGKCAPSIKKIRWCIPSGDHVAEVDIYPFWERLAVVEVELSAEDERFVLPPVLSVVREVTGERRYINRSMALELYEKGSVGEEIE